MHMTYKTLDQISYHVTRVCGAGTAVPSRLSRKVRAVITAAALWFTEMAAQPPFHLASDCKPRGHQSTIPAQPQMERRMTPVFDTVCG
jgi:hypothetical protein